TEEYANLSKTISDLSLKYWTLENAGRDLRKSMEDNLADSIITYYKRYLEERRDMHIKHLDDEMKREDERHKNQMDNYKKELDQFRKLIQERVSAIDKEESERDYNKDIDKLEADGLEILRKLNLLALDDSHEAKAQRKKLQ